MAKKKPKRSRNPGGIRTTESGAVIAHGKRAVSIARILALKSALKLEILGMKLARGVSAAQIIRDEFGWKTRDKKKLLAQLEEWIATHMRPEDESVAAQLMPDLPVKTREDNPLRIVHRSPLGGKVWRDPEHNEYRYAPAGVGPRGHRGDDVNVGFTDDLQDAIASLDATERRMTGRQKNPKQYQEWLFWMPGYETREGYVPGMYIHITSENERQSALKYGGIDVSHDAGAWRAYDRQIDDDYDSRY